MISISSATGAAVADLGEVLGVPRNPLEIAQVQNFERS